ncbi:MAG TPA: hypothetical protein VEB18_02195 [Candidatus Paceibacterota bacterium]|nr:hypothetical protein [Candidatus Paceibacterota bacterium]
MPRRNEPSEAALYAHKEAKAAVELLELEGRKDIATAMDFTDLNLRPEIEAAVLDFAAKRYALEAEKPKGWEPTAQERADMREHMTAYRNLTTEGGYVIELPVELEDGTFRTATFVLGVDGRDMLH